MGKFVVKETKTGFKFDLKATNGETIATSEVYSSESACLNGVESTKKNAPIANLEDLTENSEKKVVNPKFEVYIDKAKEFRFRLKARNGEIIVVSEGYNSKTSCLNGIESVRKNSADSETVKESETNNSAAFGATAKATKTGTASISNVDDRSAFGTVKEEGSAKPEENEKPKKKCCRFWVTIKKFFRIK